MQLSLIIHTKKLMTINEEKVNERISTETEKSTSPKRIKFDDSVYVPALED